MPSTDGDRLLLVAFLTLPMLGGCQTVPESAPAADVTPAANPTQETVHAAVADGRAPAMRRAVHALKARKTIAEARNYLLKFAGEADGDETVRAGVRLYLLLPDAEPAPMFARLIARKDVEARRTAWQLAVRYPSTAMKAAVSNELLKRSETEDGASGHALSPEAAHAIKANALADAYPLLRTSLFAQGHIAYAEAMTAINPESAAADFLSFLAQPKVERATAIYMLRSFRKVPPAVHHPRIGALFAYADSKDAELSKAAWEAMNTYGEDRDLLRQLAPEAMRAQLDQGH